MIKINILSEDIFYARMLMCEIKSVFGCAMGDIDVTVNEVAYSDSKRSGDITIVDLDGKYAGEDLNSSRIIGFSSDADIINSKKFLFCKRIFIRPFLIEDLLSFVIEETRALFDIGIDAKNEGARELTLTFEDDNNVRFCGNRLHLSKNEYEILSLLKSKESENVSRDEINLVLGGECGNMCDVYICRIRGKLAEFCNEKIIYTVRNKGYMLKLK